MSSGKKLRDAMIAENPLQIVGVINAYTALLAEMVGFKCIYLSGSGVAAASYGIPDLGITTMDDVVADAEKITAACELPLLVDIDTGWGGAFNIARTIRAMERAGVAAVHIEDQVAQKRCGHRPNKVIVSKEEMCDRIKAAVDAKVDPDFIVMARTDALAVNGLEDVLDRVGAFRDAGADAIFAEAMTDIDLYRQVTNAAGIPVLANLTEFGKTPLYHVDEMRDAGVRMCLYPLSAFRAQSQAALEVLKAIRTDGSQRKVMDLMQTRDDLYEVLRYHSYEQKLDQLFEGESSSG